jgi:hypothetical protein
LQLEVRIYGDGSLPVKLLEESQPYLPFDERLANLLELTWDPDRQEVLTHRTRPDLAPLYSVAKHARAGTSEKH